MQGACAVWPAYLLSQVDELDVGQRPQGAFRILDRLVNSLINTFVLHDPALQVLKGLVQRHVSVVWGMRTLLDHVGTKNRGLITDDFQKYNMWRRTRRRSSCRVICDGLQYFASSRCCGVRCIEDSDTATGILQPG